MLTLQHTNLNDLEQLLFDARAENSRLYDTFYALQVEIERLHRARKRGKVLININVEIMKE
jgi:hypothetical protein